jgi:glycerol-1-phosphate dehydrogenase [NAD(P)+]
MSVIWNLPKVSVRSLDKVEEHRPTALITSPEAWLPLGSVLRLPLVVQAEPSNITPAFLIQMAQQIPKQVEVIYCVGTGVPLTAAKVIASAKKLPLIVVPDALDSDELVEAHITLPAEGLLNQIDTGPATELIIDWDVIQGAPKHKRGAAIVDILAITTALLDWRYATRMSKNPPNQKFVPWAGFVAAQLGSQAVKSARDIGEGSLEGLRTLLDLVMVSVQLASQLGHDRHQEGTEHYFAFSMENQGVRALHSELVGAGILFASALHEQDPTSLREALTYAGINVDKLRISDIRLAINDLPAFSVTNGLPFARSHDLDPLSQAVNQALELAGILIPSPRLLIRHSN